MAAWYALLRQARKPSGLTQQELAAQAEVSFETVSKYERGKANPSRDTLLKLTSALHADRQTTNEILTAAGFDPLPTGRLATFERRGLPATMLAQEIDSYAWPCLVVNDQMEILLANQPANWVAELDILQAFPKLPDRHQLRLAARQHFRDRAENWEEVVSVMIEFFKAGFEDPERYADTGPWFDQLFQDLRTNPDYQEAFSQIMALWQQVPARPHLARTTFEARWRVSDGTTLRFNTVLATWDDFDAYYSNDWFPADCTTLQWLQEASRTKSERARLRTNLLEPLPGAALLPVARPFATREMKEPAAVAAGEQPAPSVILPWSQFLRFERKKSRLTRAGLALATQISEQALYSYEAGRRKPSRQTMLRLARGLLLDGATTNLLLHEAGLAPVASALARPLANLATTDPRHQLGRWDPLVQRTREALPELVAAHPWPCLVVDSRWQVVAWNAPLVSVLGYEPSGENLLHLLLRRPFREQAINYDEVITALAPSGLMERSSEHAHNPREPLPGAALLPVAPLLRDRAKEALGNRGQNQNGVALLPEIAALREEEPEAVAHLEALWEAAPPSTLSTRVVYPFVWQHADGTVLSFNGVVSLWCDYLWYWAIDWHPADTATWEWLRTAGP